MSGIHSSSGASPFMPVDGMHGAETVCESAGTLSPLRLAVKDLFHIAGLPTSAGNPEWLASHDIPNQTNEAVARLLKAGAKFVGKTITDELAYSLNGQNKHYGTPTNPVTPQRLPGGSSSGSAVAVSSHLADIGLGTDTGGSIRVPASYNNLFGLRPTHGRISTDDMVGLAPSFDTVGWLTRSIEEMEQVANVLFSGNTEESTEESAGMRLCSCADIVKLASHQQQVVDWNKTHNVALNDDLLPLLPELSNAFRILQGAEIWQQHGEWIESHKPDFADDINSRFTACKALTLAEIDGAKKIQNALVSVVNSVFQEFDCLVVPTTPGIAPLLTSSSAELAEYRTNLLTLTSIAGLAGLPQLHLPLFEEDGAPCGLSLIGPKHSDLQLIRFAKVLCEQRAE